MPGPARNALKARSRAHRGPVGARLPLVELPAAGCTLPVPSLPHGRDWTEAEQGRWVELWESPQATQWDETAAGTVAALVVYEAAIIAGTASAWQAVEYRHASAALGLTPAAMAALGWRVADE